MGANLQPALHAPEVETWFRRFAGALRDLRSVNPMEALLTSNRGNPYFITFTLYLYGIPASTRLEQANDKARNTVMPLLKGVRQRLKTDSDKLTELIGMFSFRAPFVDEFRELLQREEIGNVRRFAAALAAHMREGSKVLSRVETVLKEQASAKKAARARLEIMLLEHLHACMGLAATRRHLPLLVDCAQEAFGTTSGRGRQFDSAVMARHRYEKMYPNTYEKLKGIAVRSLRSLPKPEALKWRRLSCDDLAEIGAYLRKRLEEEDELRPSTYPRRRTRRRTRKA